MKIISVLIFILIFQTLTKAEVIVVVKNKLDDNIFILNEKSY